MANELERALAPFSIKGAAIKKLESRRGTYEDPANSDLMEKEFRPYKLHGTTDIGSPDVAGDEAEFYELGKQARDDRLVGLRNGTVARAAGQLGSGTGMLYDMNGRPIGGSVQQAPVARTRRSPKDW